jgi:Protein of unknown function (DUF3808)
MTLLIFHLFLSSFSHDGVDILMAQKIVDWNLKRYPEGNVDAFHYRLKFVYPTDLGVFFLIAQGRLSLCRSQPARAIAFYQKAMSVQTQYRNLHHISFWEMASSHLALWQVEDSLKCWRSLHKESTVCYPPLFFYTVRFVLTLYSGQRQFMPMASPLFSFNWVLKRARQRDCNS